MTLDQIRLDQVEQGNVPDEIGQSGISRFNEIGERRIGEYDEIGLNEIGHSWI